MIGSPQIVRAIGVRSTSLSQAATYQRLRIQVIGFSSRLSSQAPDCMYYIQK
jgi:hypothetical protein